MGYKWEQEWVPCPCCHETWPVKQTEVTWTTTTTTTVTGTGPSPDDSHGFKMGMGVNKVRSVSE
jgi:hypothetical protein